MTNAEARFNNSLRPRKPEGSLGRTAQDGHLNSHTAPELCPWQGSDSAEVHCHVFCGSVRILQKYIVKFSVARFGFCRSTLPVLCGRVQILQMYIVPFSVAGFRFCRSTAGCTRTVTWYGPVACLTSCCATLPSCAPIGRATESGPSPSTPVFSWPSAGPPSCVTSCPRCVTSWTTATLSTQS